MMSDLQKAVSSYQEDDAPVEPPIVPYENIIADLEKLPDESQVSATPCSQLTIVKY